jgi:NADH-quinone oxidoreductase subunit N
MYLILHLIDPIYSIVFCVSIISIIIGSVGALYQYTIKRLLAYSAIANMGFVILNLHTLNGFSSSLYFLIIYIFVSINIFTILLNIKRNDHEIKNIVEFISVAFSNYYLSILLVFALFSLAGIPPFIGFFGKLYVFINLIEYGFYYTGFIIMLLSILICVYYIRLIRFI